MSTLGMVTQDQVIWYPIQGGSPASTNTAPPSGAKPNEVTLLETFPSQPQGDPNKGTNDNADELQEKINVLDSKVATP